MFTFCTIMLDPGAVATFTNTDIRYGSASVYNGSGGQDYLPIITNAGGTLTMDNATLAYGKNAGIDTSGGATTITNAIPQPETVHFVVFFLAFMAAAALYAFLISALIAFGRRYITAGFFRVINLACGLFLGYFGISLFWNVVQEML